MKKLSLRSLSLLVVFALIASCTVNPVTGKKEFSLMSLQQEMALGQQSDPGIKRSFGMYPDEKLQAFINEKGAAMANVSHSPDMAFNFRILDSPVVNAFAVPGGYVYFTRGIMAHFNNEAEFAGVLGHEIGHVTARHSAKQYTNSVLAQVGLLAGIVLVEDFRPYAEMAGQGMQLMLLKFGRDHESQSDRLGVEYSTKIGYDSRQMAGFFHTLGRLSDTQGERLPSFLSTHPDPDDRFQKVGAYTTQWQAKTGATNLQVNRDSYLRMIDGIIYGDDPRQGYVENGRFYHPELKFQYQVPRGWKTVNSPEQVQMAPENGEALMMLTIGKGKTPKEAAEAFVSENKLEAVEGREVQVNGFSAFYVISDQYPEQQQQAVTSQAAAPNAVAGEKKDPGKTTTTGSAPAPGAGDKKDPGKTTGSGPASGGTVGQGPVSSDNTGGKPTSGAPSGKSTTGSGTSTPSSPSQGMPAPTRPGQVPSVRIVSYFIQYGEAIYAFHGMSKYETFQQYFPQFDAAIQSFQSLNDATKINVKPERVRIKTVAQTGTLESALRSFNMPVAKLKELSILNGMELTDQVQKGMLIKVLEK